MVPSPPSGMTAHGTPAADPFCGRPAARAARTRASAGARVARPLAGVEQHARPPRPGSPQRLPDHLGHDVRPA